MRTCILELFRALCEEHTRNERHNTANTRENRPPRNTTSVDACRRKSCANLHPCRVYARCVTPNINLADTPRVRFKTKHCMTFGKTWCIFHDYLSVGSRTGAIARFGRSRLRVPGNDMLPTPAQGGPFTNCEGLRGWQDPNKIITMPKTSCTASQTKLGHFESALPSCCVAWTILNILSNLCHRVTKNGCKSNAFGRLVYRYTYPSLNQLHCPRYPR